MNTNKEMPSIYQRFAQRCEERKNKIMLLLNERGEDTGDDSATSHLIGMEVHDWIGEAKLLGFDKLAAVAGELEEVLTTWESNFHIAIQGQQLQAWIIRLTDLSRRFALEAPGNELLQELQTLLSEFSSELGVNEFARIPTPVTGKTARLQDQRRILILDDSPIVGEALSLELESRGHRVALASDFNEFQQQLSDFGPEIIFLDINMPDIQGDEVCRRLRSRFETQNVPIIFLSSLPDNKLALLAKRAGADGYLSKQRGMDELIKYLDDLLSQVIF